MRTNELHDNFQWDCGHWDKCLSYRDMYSKTVYVFTNVSHKRYKGGKRYNVNADDHKRYSSYKTVFVTNKQLIDFSMPYADMHFMQEVRQLVFDGKRGTRYDSKSKNSWSSGSYFSCLRSNTYEITSRVSRKISH